MALKIRQLFQLTDVCVGSGLLASKRLVPDSKTSRFKKCFYFSNRVVNGQKLSLKATSYSPAFRSMMAFLRSHNAHTSMKYRLTLLGHLVFCCRYFSIIGLVGFLSARQTTFGKSEGMINVFQYIVGLLIPKRRLSIPSRIHSPRRDKRTVSADAM